MDSVPARTGPGTALADFLIGVPFEAIPPAIRHEAKRSLLNFMATALAGSADPTIETAAHVLSRFSGPAEATVIGRAQGVDMALAAFLNAASANVFDFDDTHLATIIHPTAPVAPPLLALAQTRPVTGQALLAAFIAGAEAACRIGLALTPDHYRRGWHVTATCGVFGAALASARLLGLSGPRANWALGNASAQAGGLVETLGTMSKSLGVGNAARNGLLSALLAEAGFSGPARPLEGPRGYLRVAADAPDIAALTRDLGERWEIGQNTYKPYPCGVVLNPVIEACLALRARETIDPAAIASITLTGHPLLRERTDRPDIATGREGQVSAQHAVAAVFVRGRAGLSEFTDAAANDPAIRALGTKLAFHDDPAMGVEAAHIALRMADGRTHVMAIAQALGSPARPLSDQALEQKLRTLAAHAGFAGDPGALIGAIWALEDTADAGALMALAQSPSTSRIA